MGIRLDDFPTPTARHWVVIWLAATCVGIWLMVMIGGITRLTESGLSIVEWDLFRGVMPPLSEAGWQAMFEKYQGSPQYRILYPEMSLEEFKSIFWWEYIHRLWGRGLGLLFGVPLVIFWLKGWVRGRLLGWLLAALVLGGAQGALGWFMVQSGLVDVPRVSGYRLTAHLLLATTLLVGLFGLCVRLGGIPRVGGVPLAVHWALVGVAAAIYLQIGLGGFMAGTRAALVAPTFPLINGEFLPPTAFAGPDVWRDVFENPFTLQFLHRVTAYALVLGAVGWAIWAWPYARGKWALVLIAGVPVCLVVQGIWGVATVVHSIGKIPVVWGVLHQVFGITTLLWAVTAVLLLSRQAESELG
ncbi:MAG: COX15/CtaA family protein [Candidatus Methylacidiphilales bacterium]